MNYFPLTKIISRIQKAHQLWRQRTKKLAELFLCLFFISLVHCVGQLLKFHFFLDNLRGQLFRLQTSQKNYHIAFFTCLLFHSVSSAWNLKVVSFFKSIAIARYIIGILIPTLYSNCHICNKGLF